MLKGVEKEMKKNEEKTEKKGTKMQRSAKKKEGCISGQRRDQEWMTSLR